MNNGVLAITTIYYSNLPQLPRELLYEIGSYIICQCPVVNDIKIFEKCLAHDHKCICHKVIRDYRFSNFTREIPCVAKQHRCVCNFNNCGWECKSLIHRCYCYVLEGMCYADNRYSNYPHRCVCRIGNYCFAHLHKCACMMKDGKCLMHKKETLKYKIKCSCTGKRTTCLSRINHKCCCNVEDGRCLSVNNHKCKCKNVHPCCCGAKHDTTCLSKNHKCTCRTIKDGKGPCLSDNHKCNCRIFGVDNCKAISHECTCNSLNCNPKKHIGYHKRNPNVPCSCIIDPLNCKAISHTTS